MAPGPALLVATVPTLIGILYLLSLRTSGAEAKRFGTTARAMRAEAAALEATVATLSARIELNRAELAHQTQAFEVLGPPLAESTLP